MWKRVTLLWTLVRGDLRRIVRAWRHPASPRWLKPAVLGVLAYVIWPFDLLPDMIPVLGVVDDLIVVPLALRFILKRLPPAVLADIERGAAL